MRRRSLVAVMALVIVHATGAACTSATVEAGAESTAPTATDPPRAADLPQPGSDFCRAAQASLARIALDELPTTVEEGRTFYEESWRSVARTARTESVRVAADTVVDYRQTVETESVVRARVEAAMTTVYQAVSDECPDLAVPVRLLLVRILVTAKTTVNVITEIWRSIVEVLPLPALAAGPEASAPSTTTTSQPPHVLVDDTALCQSYFDLIADLVTWLDAHRRAPTPEVISHERDTVSRFLTRAAVDAAPDTAVKQKAAAFLDALAGNTHHILYEAEENLRAACDASTGPRTWPVSG